MVSHDDNPERKDPIEERSKALFDASVNDLDGRTRSALTQARHAALAELERTRRPLVWRMLGPVAGGVAAAFVLLALFAPLRFTPTAVKGTVMPFEDLELVAEPGTLEMLQDLEFYAWLDSSAALAQACGGGPCMEAPSNDR